MQIAAAHTAKRWTTSLRSAWEDDNYEWDWVLIITIPLYGPYKLFTLHKIILVHLIQLSSFWLEDLRRAAQKHQREARGTAGKKSWSSLWSNVEHKVEPRIILTSSVCGLRADNRATRNSQRLSMGLRSQHQVVVGSCVCSKRDIVCFPKFILTKTKQRTRWHLQNISPPRLTNHLLTPLNNHLSDVCLIKSCPGTEGPLKSWCLTKASKQTSAPWRRCSSAPQHRACPPPPAVTTLWLHEPLDTTPERWTLAFGSNHKMTSRPSHTASSAQASCTCRRPPIIPPPSPWQAPQGCQCTCIAAVAWPSITPVRFVTNLFEQHIA